MNTQTNHLLLGLMRHATLLQACLTGGLLATAHCGAQNVIVNGSFELNPIPTGQTSAFGVSGWSGMGSQDAVRVLASSGWGELPAPLPDGVQVLAFFASGEINQVFTLQEAASLSFSIWTTLIPNSRGGTTPNLSSSISITDGTTSKGFNITASPIPGWQRHDWDVGTQAPGTYALHIFPSIDLAYDNVSLAAVPEPGIVSLLGIGTVLLCLRWLPRRSKG